MAYNTGAYVKVGTSFHRVNYPTHWNLIEDMPTNFPPTAHNHDASNINAGTLHADRIPTLPQSKITNLETDLGLKATKTYVHSRGQNLLTNGTALLGNNTNFSALTFDGSVANNSPGSFKYISAGTIYTDEYMPVEATKRYKMSVDAKSLNGTGRYYMMTVAYDVDNKLIQASHHMYRANTLTTLAQDLKNGDTIVHLTNATNWDNSGTAGVNTHLRSIILWNYSNSFGYLYPPLTYSRNYYINAWDPGAINFSTNTITLRTAWAGGTIPAGTALSNGSSGGTFKYNVMSGVLLTTNWVTYTGIMDGMDYSGTNISTKFAPGTAKIKLGWLMNYGGSGETAWFTNMSVSLDYQREAEKLKTPRTINGVNFDGSANINISAPASDVSEWAKASTKPSYNQDEVGDGTTYKRVTQIEKNNWNAKLSEIPSHTDDVGSFGKATTALYGHAIIKNDLNTSEYLAGEVLSAHQGYLLNQNKVAKNTAITGETKCKITYDAKGLVTAGDNLEYTDLPTVPVSKGGTNITSLSGHADKVVRVNSSGNGYTFSDGAPLSGYTKLFTIQANSATYAGEIDWGLGSTTKDFIIVLGTNSNGYSSNQLDYYYCSVGINTYGILPNFPSSEWSVSGGLFYAMWDFTSVGSKYLSVWVR